MSALPVLMPVFLLLVGGVVLPLVPGRGPITELGPRPRVRPEVLARWAGLALGVALAWWTSRSGSLGIGLMLAPTAFGVGAVLGVLGADTLTPTRRGTVRRAGLTPRRIRDYLPVRFTAVVAGFAAALVTLLVVTTATGSADDLGRSGRSFSEVCGDLTEGRGPWPGSYYSVPLLTALAAATAVCGLALHRMARRPAADEPAARPMDDGRRRVGATDVVAAWGFLVTGSLSGTGLAVVGAISDLTCPGGVTRAAYWVLLPVVIGAAVTALYCLAVLCGTTARRS